MHQAVRQITLLFCSVFSLAVLSHVANAQTFTVLHSFTGAADGEYPQAGITVGPGGNLYGTAYQGGTSGGGTVFEIRKHSNGNWFLTPIHEFQLYSQDASLPGGRVVFGPSGLLYGMGNGGANGWGAVYALQLPPTPCLTAICYWQESVLYSFMGGQDGGEPGWVDPVFDSAGNLYGTTQQRGANDRGVVFELSPSANGWTETVLHSFDGSDGASPDSSVLLDRFGNVYGTTEQGGTRNGEGNGAVFELSPSGSGWTDTSLHLFVGGLQDGAGPYSGLTADPSGSLYGTTTYGGLNDSGTLFKLTPAGDGWIYSYQYSFSGLGGPWGTLVEDSAGNLYGTSYAGGAYRAGAVFRLTPSSGSWIYTSLHDFTGGSDGETPLGGVAFDANGDIFGTTSYGGTSGLGVVWEITP